MDRDFSAGAKKRVVKWTFSNLFVKIKALDKQLADLRLSLKMDFGFSTVWVQSKENWILKPLGKKVSDHEVKKRLKRKFKWLKEENKKIQKNRVESPIKM